MSIPSRSRGSATHPVCELSIVVFLLVVLAMPRLGAAATAGGCMLSGSAHFNPGVSYVPQFGAQMSLTGVLSLCQSAPDAGPAEGTASIGNVWKQPGTPDWQWQEPFGVAQGGCVSAIARGTVIARWADGTRTVLAIDAVSVVGELVVTGAVLDSVTLTAVNPKEGQPSSLTVTTNRFTAGALVSGQLNVIGPEAALLTCGVGGTPDIFFIGGTTVVDD